MGWSTTHIEMKSNLSRICPTPKTLKLSLPQPKQLLKGNTACGLVAWLCSLFKSMFDSLKRREYPIITRVLPGLPARSLASSPSTRSRGLGRKLGFDWRHVMSLTVNHGRWHPPLVTPHVAVPQNFSATRG
jgi:hypothetical protein